MSEAWTLDVVRKHLSQRTFVILPNQDYKATPASSEAWIRLAMIHLMLRRLAPV